MKTTRNVLCALLLLSAIPMAASAQLSIGGGISVGPHGHASVDLGFGYDSVYGYDNGPEPGYDNDPGYDNGPGYGYDNGYAYGGGAPYYGGGYGYGGYGGYGYGGYAYGLAPSAYLFVPVQSFLAVDLF